MSELYLKEVKDLLEKNKLLIKYEIKEDKKIHSISCDSRKLCENSLFFCKGEKFKVDYLEESLNNGAIAYISEQYYSKYKTSYFIVTDVLKAMAIISARFYNYPRNSFELIGVTGTKGKTTITYFLKAIFETYLKNQIGLISSIDTITGMRKEESYLTTPESIDLHKMFDEMSKSNIKYTVMEVSSQGYKRHRLFGIEFDYGIFTNIAEDHISKIEHESFEDYLNCKIEFLKHCNTIILNRDIDYLDKITSQITDKKIIYYGTNELGDYYIKNIEKQKNGFKFDVVNEKQGYCSNFSINMAGRFNIENAVAAIVVAKLHNIDDKIIRKTLEKTVIDGRMNIYEQKGITVIVDYAHNGYSFTKLFESIKTDYPNRRIISVGGIVGGKAYNRRKEFGKIVGDNSDYIYLTANDPQFEDVRDICNDIAKYISKKDKYEIVIDRTKAVQKAIMNAKKGDVVVLLAKGSEHYIKVKNENVKYDGDLIVAKRALKLKR